MFELAAGVGGDRRQAGRRPVDLQPGPGLALPGPARGSPAAAPAGARRPGRGRGQAGPGGLAGAARRGAARGRPAGGGRAAAGRGPARWPARWANVRCSPACWPGRRAGAAAHAISPAPARSWRQALASRQAGQEALLVPGWQAGAGPPVAGRRRAARGQPAGPRGARGSAPPTGRPAEADPGGGPPGAGARGRWRRRRSPPGARRGGAGGRHRRAALRAELLFGLAETTLAADRDPRAVLPRFAELAAEARRLLYLPLALEIEQAWVKAAKRAGRGADADEKQRAIELEAKKQGLRPSTRRRGPAGPEANSRRGRPSCRPGVRSACQPSSIASEALASKSRAGPATVAPAGAGFESRSRAPGGRRRRNRHAAPRKAYGRSDAAGAGERQFLPSPALRGHHPQGHHLDRPLPRLVAVDLLEAAAEGARRSRFVDRARPSARSRARSPGRGTARKRIRRRISISAAGRPSAASWAAAAAASSASAAASSPARPAKRLQQLALGEPFEPRLAETAGGKQAGVDRQHDRAECRAARRSRRRAGRRRPPKATRACSAGS